MDGRVIELRLGPPSEPDIEPWVAVAIALVLLTVTSLFAWRRARRLDASPPWRGARILWTSVTCSASLTLILIPNELNWARLHDEGFGTALLFRFVGWTIPAVMLFGTADLLLDYFRPRRGLVWLLIAPFLFTAFILGIVASTDWLEIDTSRTGPAPIAAVIAASLIWWSLLPATPPRAPDPHMVDIFE